MNYISFNGRLMGDTKPVLQASNRGYRYGDGLFETIKVSNGKIMFEDLHFERLFKGLELLNFEIPRFFTAQNLAKEILDLCRKNNCTDLARIRLSMSRGNGGLYDGDLNLQYIIECWPLNQYESRLNENGLIIDIFPDAEKSCDKFSNLKSSNGQIYSLAALYSKEKKLNDCLILNVKGNIADSTIANLFIIKDDVIITPPLNDGCISGVMRRYLITSLKNAGWNVEENSITIEILAAADEVFLTNAIKGIRWVRQCRDSVFTNSKTVEIFKQFIQTKDN